MAFESAIGHSVGEYSMNKERDGSRPAFRNWDVFRTVAIPVSCCYADD